MSFARFYSPAASRGAVSLADFVVFDGDVQGATGADQDDQLFGAGNGRIQQIALQHHVMLGHDRQ